MIVLNETDWSICQYENVTQLKLLTLQTMNCYVNPIVSILGFIANMMSIEILRRSGLSKPSNILLLGLVVSDSMSQMTTMNFAIILETFGPNWEYPELCGWQYGDGLNYFLFVFNIIFKFLGFWGQYVNTAMPVLIVVERFFAVFKPLTFRKLITRRKAITSVVFTYFMWLPWAITWMSMYRLHILLSKIMVMSNDVADINDVTAFNIFYFYICDIMTSWFPMTFVLFGCILTWVKVKMTLSQRKKLTSANQRVQWSNKTTRTLLTTCVIFTTTRIICSLMNYLIRGDEVLIAYIKIEFVNLVFLINSSSNFFVYVFSNRKLFIIFKQIIHLDKKE
ncbi:G-protein coupled receptor [Biomphalaria glabrata]|nr:putative G-protein coupled receptor [Biomphalaria glabrata]